MQKLFRLHSVACILLLLIATSALVAAVKEAVREVEDAAFFPVARFAVLSIYVFGLSKWSARRTWALVLPLGLVAAFLESARLIEPIKMLISSIPGAELQILSWVFKKEILDLSLLQAQWLAIINTASSFGLNILRASVNEPQVREFFWDIPLLLLSAWAGWGISRRKQALLALAPSIAFHAFILNYTGRNASSLQAAIFALIVLVGLNQNWTLPQDKGEPVNKAARETYLAIFLLSLILAVAAGWAPSISIQALAEKLSSKNELADAIGLEKDTVQSHGNAGLPRQQLVGESPSLANTIIFTAKTGELLPKAEEDGAVTQPPPRHYWRTLIYDVYNGQGWSTSSSQSIEYGANTSLFSFNKRQYQVVHQTIEKSSPQDNHLYWTGSLVRANQPFETTWRTSPTSITSDGNPLLSTDMLGSLTNGQVYSADSVIPLINENELRTSSQTYPQEITERYLSIPGTTPARVLQLARDLTSTVNNPYDKAKAIESYLRTFPYQLKVPKPPADRDVADYFLFDLKTGYCDYYATSMVVLARAAGLPARLVIGYSSGEYDRTKAEYIVRELHAHSWVEVYFTDVGWVEFEPTANMPVMALSDNATDQSFNPLPASRETKFIKSAFFAKKRHSPISVLVAAILLLGSIQFLQLQGWKFGTYESIASMYQYIYLHGKKIYKDGPVHETPSAFAERLKKKLGLHYPFLREAPAEIDTLTRLYIQETYSSHPIDEEGYKQAGKAWRKLFWRLLYARMMDRLMRGQAF